MAYWDDAFYVTADATVRGLRIFVIWASIQGMETYRTETVMSTAREGWRMLSYLTPIGMDAKTLARAAPHAFDFPYYVMLERTEYRARGYNAGPDSLL